MVLFYAALCEARPLTPADFDHLREVDAPSVSPDGHSVVYEVSSINIDKDKSSSDLYLVSTDGTAPRRLTSREDSESSPSFSPDGRWIAFLSARDDERESAQLWVLPTDGGEARRVTDLPGGVGDFDWSPDSQRLVVVAYDADPDALAAIEDPERPPVPLVLDRFWFKEDGTGYLQRLYQHLVMVDLQTGESVALTSGESNEWLPAFSPDGSKIAFVSKRGLDPDRSFDFDVFVMDASGQGQAVEVTADNPGSDCDPDWNSRPRWSPDGRWLAVVQGRKPELFYYDTVQVVLVPAQGGPARQLLPGSERNSWMPVFSNDGRQVYFLYEDDGTQRLGAARADGSGKWTLLTPKTHVISAFDVGGARKDQVVLLAEQENHPPEVAALDKGAVRWLSTENQHWRAEVSLATAQTMSFPSADGSEIHGFVLAPDSPGPHPTYLRLHGGPVSQYDRSFLLETQIWVSRGYAVLLPNPRGSSGRGEVFSTAIFADWGNLDTQDVLGAVDWAVKAGIADPNRLIVGGWSYGGILTDHVIARDQRFKAAISGAGIGNVFGGYGTDMYVREYLAELGAPWVSPDLWVRTSYPFLHADQIRTPTLFLVGLDDVNVPVVGSEQMYQALRTLGVPTRLVLYPGQAHEFDRPSFLRDRMERRLQWAEQYVGAKR